MLKIRHFAKPKNVICHYPNPSSGKFNIKTPHGFNKKVNVTILDATLNQVIKQVIPVGKEIIDIDISNFSKGLYYIQLIIDNDTFIKQLLKN